MTYRGRVVLNYELTAKLGEGGFGTVYLAQHVEIGRKTACKILHPQFAQRPEIVERFFREAKAVCAIGHPAIVEVENFGRLDTGEPFYLMEYFPGRSLAELLAQRALDGDELIAVFAPVAAALTAAHAAGIIHRDLKPENIMVREDRGRVTEVKLLDFGIAKLLDQNAMGSATGSTYGTPAYMAPEQALDAKNVDQRADVYAFGATVFHAVTRRPPFWGNSATEILIKAQTEAPPGLRDLRPDAGVRLEAAVARCLAKQPDLRPGSIAEAWDAIAGSLPSHTATLTGAAGGLPMAVARTVPAPSEQATVLAGGAPSPPPGPPDPPTRPWAGGAPATVLADAPTITPPRGKAPLIVAAVAVAAIVVVAIVLLTRKGGEPRAAVAPDAPVRIDARPPDAAPAIPPDAAPAIPPDAAPAAPIDAAPPPIDAGRKKPDPPKLDCAIAGFARVYDQDAPSPDAVNAALARLRKCKAELGDAQFKKIQTALIAKL